jgi:hypothetical protein
MKTIKIIFLSLKDFFIMERTIFLIMIISLIASSFSTFAIFALAEYQIISTRANFENQQKFYSVSFEDNIAIKQINDLINNFSNEIDNYELVHNTSQFEIHCSANINDANVFWYEKEDFKLKDKNFNFAESSGICAIDYHLVNYEKRSSVLGTITNVDGQDYTIGGVFGAQPKYNLVYISISDFQKMKYDVNEIHIKFKKIPDKKQINNFCEKINSLSSNAYIEYPSKTDTASNKIYINNILQGSAIIFLAMIGVATIFYYWLQESLQLRLVQYISGAHTFEIFIQIIAEAFILGGISFFAGIILYKILELFLPQYRFTMLNLIVSGIIYFTFLFLFVGIYAGYSCKNLNIKNVKGDVR